MKKGKLVLIVGLPGSGKGTLIAHLREQFPEIVFPVSWTTRPRRPGENEGDVYHFASDDEFSRSVGDGEFLEWVSIDGGHRYGTRKNEIVPPLEEGKLVLREVEIQGARRLKKLLPHEDIVSIFINTGSWDDLSARMLARAPMSAEELAKRKERYEKELSFKNEADFVVENQYGKLDEAKRQVSAILQSLRA